MLGIRFCPRLRDSADRRLATLKPASAYCHPAPLLGRRVKADVVREHWGEVLRLVASLRAGTVMPLAMLKKLAAYRRQNGLDLGWWRASAHGHNLRSLDAKSSPGRGASRAKMLSHTFSVGQNVEFLPGFMNYAKPSGAYVITRRLPVEAAGPSYHARSLRDGIERVLCKTQLRASQPSAEPSAARLGRSSVPVAKLAVRTSSARSMAG